MVKTLVVAGLLLTGAGCIAPHYRENEWPSGMPAKSYYTDIFERDAENAKQQTREAYLSWAIRFYEGYSIYGGWKKTSARLLAYVSEEWRSVMAARMAYWGQLVSGEWAKHNRVRRISAKSLSLWMGVLKRSKKEALLSKAVDAFLVDTLSILDGSMEPSDVTSDRYASLLEKVTAEESETGR